MPNIAEAVESLLKQHGVSPSNLESFLDLAENHQSFTYSDVSCDLTSGAWGFLIEKDVVQSVDDGFTVEDPAAVRKAVSHAGAASSTETDKRDGHGAPTTEPPMTNDEGQRSGTRPGALRWQFEADDGVYRPAVTDDVIFATSNDRNLYALDRDTGNELWRLTVGGTWISSPTVANGSVYVGGNDGTLYAVRAADGTVQWRSDIVESDDGGRLYTPAVADDVVFVGGNSTHLSAVDAATGELKWCFDARHNFEYAPAVSNGVLYAGNRDGKLYAIDVTSGTERWHFKAEAYVRARYISGPTVANGTVYFGSSDTNLYAIETNRGVKRWKFKTDGGINSSPVVADGTVYVGSTDGCVYAVDASDGTERWHFETNGSVDCSPDVTDGVVYIGSEDDHVYALDGSDGTKRWDFETGGSINQAPVATDDTVYISSYDNRVYAIATSSVEKHGAEFSTPAVGEGETGAIVRKESLVSPETDELGHDTDESTADLVDGGDTDDTDRRVTSSEAVDQADDVTVVRSVYLPLKMAESLREARERETAPVRTCRDRAKELHDFVDQYAAATAEQSHADLCDDLRRLVTSLDGAVLAKGVTDIRPGDDLYRRIESVTYQAERFFLRLQHYDSVE